MSESKKYYYLKLKDNFFDSEEMKLLESQKNGVEYQNLYLKLCLLSIKNEGRLMFKDLLPYDMNMLSTILRISIDTVKTGIELLAKLNLVEIMDSGAMYMTDIQSLIGHGSSESERKAVYRQKMDNERTKVGQSPGHFPPEIELKKEKEKEKKSPEDCAQKSAPIPGYPEIISLYFTLHEEKTGTKPIYGAVEGKLLKALLNTQSQEVIEEKLRLYYQHSFWFNRAGGYSFKLFHAHYNEIVKNEAPPGKEEFRRQVKEKLIREGVDVSNF